MATKKYTAQCNACKTPRVTTLLYEGKLPRCGICGQLMQILSESEDKPAVVAKQLSPFDETAGRMRAACAKGTPYAKYVDAVIEHLRKREASKFQPDFIAELRPEKKVDVGKFTIGVPPRAAKAGDICVDNAFAAAGTDLPAGCPKGEKFTFEIPYIMADAGWTHLKSCVGAGFLAYPMISFLNEIAQSKPKAHTAFLVVWSLEKGATESHMIYVVVKKDAKAAWIVDAQAQPADYGTGCCEVWQCPADKNIAKAEGIVATLDLNTGETGEFSKKSTSVALG